MSFDKLSLNVYVVEFRAVGFGGKNYISKGRRGQEWGEKFSWVTFSDKVVACADSSRNKIRPTIFNDKPNDHPTITQLSHWFPTAFDHYCPIHWLEFPLGQVSRLLMLSARPPTKHFLFRCESRDSRAPNESKINYKAFFMYNEWKSTKLSLKLDRFWRLLAGDFFSL